MVKSRLQEFQKVASPKWRILSNFDKTFERAKFGPVKMTFRAIQPNPSYDMLLMSSQRSFMPKKRKSYLGVSEIAPPPPFKVDAAVNDDNGRVGI